MEYFLALKVSRWFGLEPLTIASVNTAAESRGGPSPLTPRQNLLYLGSRHR